MPSDLTERLAAKLAEDWREDFALSVASWAPQLLRFFLSEQDLVASLPESVRLSVLTPRERAVMKLGEAYLAERAVWTDGRRDTMNHEVLSDWSHDHTAVVKPLRVALAEARALTPEAR